MRSKVMSDVATRPLQRLLFSRSPLEGEALCSWLLRLAGANGHRNALPLLKAVDYGRPVAATPIELNERLVTRLATVSGIGVETVESFLSDHVGNALATFPHRALYRWLLRSNKKRKAQCFSLCSKCLGEGEPFWRSAWRFATAVRCPTHGCLMLERCSECASPFTLSASREAPLSQCERCKTSLLSLRTPAGERPSFADFPDTNTFPVAGSLDVAELPAAVAVEALFWDGLWFLASSFCRRQLAARLDVLTFLPRPASAVLARLSLSKKTLPFEELDASEREVMLQFVWWLCQDWPRRFVSVMKEARIHSFALLGRDIETPYWIRSVVKERLASAAYRPTFEEVDAAVAHLRRRQDRMPARIEVKRLLGLAETQHLDRTVEIHTRPLDWSDMSRIAAFLDRLIGSADRRRFRQAAMVRDAMLIATCALAGATFHRVCAMATDEVCELWDAKTAERRQGFIFLAAKWKREYEETVRPRWANRESRAPIDRYFLTRFGRPYEGNTAVSLVAEALAAVDYRDRWRGIAVVRDLHNFEQSHVRLEQPIAWQMHSI